MSLKMVFSSEIFLYLFLPMVMLGGYLLRNHIGLANLFLFASSLLFYAWGEPFVVFIMLLSILSNWYFALQIERARIGRKWLLAISLSINVGILFVFKYLGFVIFNVNLLVGANWPVPQIALPIGISFFTFQALSYVVDVYRRQVPAQRNLMKVGLYISLFPQLVAGPIVRYGTIERQMDDRRISVDDVVGGIERFVIGLSKKVLVADNVARLADIYFDVNIGALADFPALGLWLGAVAYSFQILFDFSGYSDMAIGLGRIFGFRFEENFNRPYLAKSVSDFWRRWHMSLGGWFRDYVYIPLGGNRVPKRRLIVNLFVVWSLTGLWHGANWTFVVWGIGYFVLLTAEKIFDWRVLPHRMSCLLRPYTLFCVLILWIVFRSPTMTYAGHYVRGMFLGSGLLTGEIVGENLRDYGGWLFVATFVVFGWPLIEKMIDKNNLLVAITRELCLVAVAIASLGAIANSSYSPFIYFNF